MAVRGSKMAKLVCPHCGASTVFSPARVVGTGILTDSSDKTTTVYGKVEILAITPYDYGGTDHVYAILVCGACEQYFVAEREEYADEWLAVHPIQHKAAPEDIPQPIRSEFEEANLCFAVKAYRACVSMCQITLEALWHEQQVSGLDQLKDKISATLYNGANEIRLWGNLAKHELIIDPVSKEGAEQLLGYLEMLLNEVYVEPQRLDSLAKRRKELEKKD